MGGADIQYGLNILAALLHNDRSGAPLRPWGRGRHLELGVHAPNHVDRRLAVGPLPIVRHYLLVRALVDESQPIHGGLGVGELIDRQGHAKLRKL